MVVAPAVKPQLMQVLRQSRTHSLTYSNAGSRKTSAAARGGCRPSRSQSARSHSHTASCGARRKEPAPREGDGAAPRQPPITVGLSVCAHSLRTPISQPCELRSSCDVVHCPAVARRAPPYNKQLSCLISAMCVLVPPPRHNNESAHGCVRWTAASPSASPSSISSRVSATSRSIRR
jgi:hypothetical protein